MKVSLRCGPFKKRIVGWSFFLAFIIVFVVGICNSDHCVNNNDNTNYKNNNNNSTVDMKNSNNNNNINNSNSNNSSNNYNNNVSLCNLFG